MNETLAAVQIASISAQVGRKVNKPKTRLIEKSNKIVRNLRLTTCNLRFKDI
jgi:hypothetical protein